ncbi:hypothetical protein TM01_09125 [Campylobacter jejuni subsp. jejuni]|nr:hypothetical protein TM01_09125 [Campylobacter jejuni subsp. jejuni]
MVQAWLAWGSGVAGTWGSNGWQAVQVLVTHGSEVADMWLLHESSVADVWFRCGWLVVQMRMACGSSKAVPRSRDAGSLLAFRWHKVGTWLTHGSCVTGT